MTLINAIFLSFIGLASGFVVAAGIFAFITMLGIIPRLAQRTGTADHIYGYEWMIILGGWKYFEFICDPFTGRNDRTSDIWTVFRHICGMSCDGAGGKSPRHPGFCETDAAEAGTSGYLTGDGAGKMHGKYFAIFL